MELHYVLALAAAMITSTIAAVPAAYHLDASCNLNPDIAEGLSQAIDLATQARDLLSAPGDPFANGADPIGNNNPSVFWAPLRNVLWGSGTQSPTPALLRKQ